MDGTTKYLFKEAMRGVLPDAIIDRRKHGFSVPLNRWFRGAWSEFVRDLLLSETARRRGIFEAGYIEQLLKLHAGGRDLNAHLWTLVSLELWCRKFLDTDRRHEAVLPPVRQAKPAAVRQFSTAG